MQIGQAIRELRLGLKIPKGVFAEKVCEVSSVTLRAIENSKKLPSGKVLVAIERNLGLPISYLMFFALSDEDIKGVELEAHKELRRRILGQLGAKRDELLRHSPKEDLQKEGTAPQALQQESVDKVRKTKTRTRSTAITSSRFRKSKENAALALT